MVQRTPLELIHLYWDRVWNNGETQLIREICADPIVRHEENGLVPLSHDEQIARIERVRPAHMPLFTHEVLVASDTHVASVWNMSMRKGEPRDLSGIEVFKVVDGRLAETWVSAFHKGHWPVGK